MSNYFTINEVEKYLFYRVPKLLFSERRYSDLSTDAKLLYGLMLDRMRLSIRNRWVNESGHVFIFFTQKEIMSMLNCRSAKADRLLDELEQHELIEKKRNGLGRPNSIYLKKIEPDITIEQQKFQKRISRNSENEYQEIPKTNISIFENQISSSSINEPQEIRFPNCIKNDIKNTDFFDINPNRNQSICDGDDLTRLIKHNIDYDFLVAGNDFAQINEILKIIIDVMSTSGEIRVGKTTRDANDVKRRFLEIESKHVEYVLDCLNKTKTKITNIRSYLITALYNSTETIDLYYSAEVNHDLRAD